MFYIRFSIDYRIEANLVRHYMSLCLFIIYQDSVQTGKNQSHTNSIACSIIKVFNKFRFFIFFIPTITIRYHRIGVGTILMKRVCEILWIFPPIIFLILLLNIFDGIEFILTLLILVLTLLIIGTSS